jgi:hypothetical protein
MESQLFIVEDITNLKHVNSQELAYSALYVISTFGPENIIRVLESYNTGKYIGKTINNESTFNIGHGYHKRFNNKSYYFYTYLFNIA